MLDTQTCLEIHESMEIIFVNLFEIIMLAELRFLRQDKVCQLIQILLLLFEPRRVPARGYQWTSIAS